MGHMENISEVDTKTACGDGLGGDIESARTPAALPGHPECGSRGENSGLFKVATKHGGARRGSGPKPKPIITPFCQTGPRWYCVQTKPGGELLVMMGLAQQEIIHHLPIVVTADKQVPMPLFPRYLFVQFDVGQDAWRGIPHTPGVTRLFSASAERPIPMRRGIVESWIERAAADGGVIDGRPVQAAPIDVGSEVRITAGPLADLVGLCRRSSVERVAVLLTVMGRSVEVDMPSDRVEKVRA